MSITDATVALTDRRGSPRGDDRYPIFLIDEVERYLAALRFSSDPMSAGLAEAMRYSLLAGGKRIRPVLALATARALGADHRPVLPLAAAIELIHTFSLIHDDLPAMDDDDLRRGRPTNHRVFGDGVAILAGDALFAEAFRLVAHCLEAPPGRVVAAFRVIADAVATDGLAGGQYADITGSARDNAAILHLHRLKTGALLEACVRSVVELVHPLGHAAQALTTYAAELGVMFQIVDDILDITRTSDDTGKSAGSDARNGRRTLVSVGSTERAARLADECLERIMHVLGTARCETAELLAIATVVRHRHG